VSDEEAALKALHERLRDAGWLSFTIYMQPGKGPRYAGPHMTADQFDELCLTAMRGYRDAMKPRAVN
jgi:hypothetical protein